MTTALRPVSASVPQNSVHSEPSSKWAILIGGGIVGAVFFYLMYRFFTTSSSHSSEKKEISSTPFVEPEKVLCIFRIFREAVRKHTENDSISATVWVGNDEGKRLHTQNITLIKEQDYADLVTLLPKYMHGQIQIKSENFTVVKDLQVMGEKGRYHILKQLPINPKVLQETNSMQAIDLRRTLRTLTSASKDIYNSDTLTLSSDSQSLKIENNSFIFDMVVQINIMETNTADCSLHYSVNARQSIQLSTKQIISDYRQAHQSLQIGQSFPAHSVPDYFTILSVRYITLTQVSR